MTRRKKITIQDIAQELNVSFATVSNALNYRKGVSEEVRELIFAQAQKMGYPIKPKPVEMSQDLPYGAYTSGQGNAAGFFNQAAPNAFAQMQPASASQAIPLASLSTPFQSSSLLQSGSLPTNIAHPAYQANTVYPANNVYQANAANSAYQTNVYNSAYQPNVGYPSHVASMSPKLQPVVSTGNLGTPQGTESLSNSNVSTSYVGRDLQPSQSLSNFAVSAATGITTASSLSTASGGTTSNFSNPLGTPSVSSAAQSAALLQNGQTSLQNSILENMRLAVFLDSFFVQEIPSFYLEIFKNIIQACSSLHCCANLIPVVHNSVEVNLSSLNNLSCQGGIIIGQLPQTVIDNLKSRLNVPFIVLDHFDDGDESLHFIQLDSFISMHILVNEIIKRGYQDICFVGSIHQTKSILDRFLGYAKAMEEHGLKQHIRYIEDRDFSKGPWLTFELPDKLPQIFVCNCDKTAALVVHTLQQKGLNIPQDVAVAGFDNFGAQINSKLRLFTFEHSPQILANLALQTIASQLQHQPLEHSLFIEGRIIQGNSILERITSKLTHDVNQEEYTFPKGEGDSTSHAVFSQNDEHLTTHAVSARNTDAAQNIPSASPQPNAASQDQPNTDSQEMVESIDSRKRELNLEIKADEIAEAKLQDLRTEHEKDEVNAINIPNSPDVENTTTKDRLSGSSSDSSARQPSTSITEFVEHNLQAEKTAVSSGNVTLQDIAKVLKTSTVTVSNALSGKAGVSDEMRTKIVVTAQKLGYVPRGMKKRAQLQQKGQLGLLGNQYVDCLAPVIQANAYALNKPLQHLICIVVAKRYLTVGGSFYWELYQHMISSTLQYGFTTTIAIMDDQQIENNIIPDAITLNRPDGIVAMGPFPKLYLQHLSQQGLPCMQLDASEHELQLPAVMTNNYINSYKITHHLILQGHSKIGFVGTRSGFDNITDRFYGFKRAMLESKLPIHEEWILDDRDQLSGRMFDEIDLPENLPTAFVCNCDAAAYLIYSTLRTQGIKVPQDVSLVGYDNYLYGVDFANDLTTINVDLKKMAEHTVRNMLCLIQHQPLSCRVERLECRIMQRNSVQPLINPVTA